MSSRSLQGHYELHSVVLRSLRTPKGSRRVVLGNAVVVIVVVVVVVAVVVVEVVVVVVVVVVEVVVVVIIISFMSKSKVCFS